MPVRARQLALLLAVAAGAFVGALMLGRTTKSADTVALPAAKIARDAQIRGAGSAVAIPAMRVARLRVPARAGSGSAPRPAPATTTTPQRSQSPGARSPSPSPAPAPSSGGGDDVVVSG